MHLTKETDPLFSSLKSLFDETRLATSNVGKLSLWALARELNTLWEREEKSLSLWLDSLYWLSCLILWKGEWLILQKPSHSVLAEPSAKLQEKPKALKSTVKLPKSDDRKKLDSLVMYLEHKTFQTLAGRPKPKGSLEKLDKAQLEELYKNLSKEKGKAQNLSHIHLLTAEASEKDLLPENWDQVLLNWSEERSINAYLAECTKNQQVAIFQDLLFRQKKGELFLSQEEPNAPLYIKHLEHTVASYG